MSPTIHADSHSSGGSSLTATAINTMRNAVAIPENELKRWKRAFEANAKVFNGEK
jgi:solute carrier family 25 aspartate/glutamate transporter 12/13